MMTVRLTCIVVLTVACIQYSDAWLHSWSSGSHTITGDVSIVLLASGFSRF